MEDAFRFMLVRPAEEPEVEPLDVTMESPFQAEVAAAIGRNDRAGSLAAASRFAASPAFIARVEALAHGEQLARWLGLMRPFDAASRESVDAATSVVFGTALGQTVGTQGWVNDCRNAVDSVIAASLVRSRQRELSGDVADAIRAMELLERLAKDVPVTDEDVRRVLTAPLTLPSLKRVRETSVRGAEAPPPAPPAERARLGALSAAKKELMNLPITKIAPKAAAPPEPPPSPVRGRFAVGAGEVLGRVAGVDLLSAATGSAMRRGLALKPGAGSGLSQGTRNVLTTMGLDPEQDDLPQLLMHIDSERKSLAKFAAGTSLVGAAIAKRALGSKFGLQLFGTDPLLPLPTTHGSVRPSGVGDLLIVRQQLIGYEAADIAHVQNVLEGEENIREHRRRDLTEEEFETETETVREEERELETTDRNEISREVEETLKEELEAEAGVKLTASYGPTVSIEVTGRVAYKSSKETSQRAAQEFSHQVIEKTVNKISERIRERRKRRVVHEIEEFNRHALTNPAGNGNVVGIYQWLTKVYEAQIFNYGQRTIYDLVVPEPAAFIRHVTDPSQHKSDVPPPEPLTIDAADIEEDTYQSYVALYEAVGVNPPPAPFTHVSTTARIEPTAEDGNKAHVDAKILNIPDGYQALAAHVGAVFPAHTSEAIHVAVTVGRRLVTFDSDSGVESVDLDGETGTIPVGMVAHGVAFATMTVEIECRATDRATEVWRNQTFAAIQQAYLAQLQAYEERKSADRGAVVIKGSNPAENQRKVRDELKRACLSIVTAQHFDAFNAVRTDAAGWPRVDLERIEERGRYARFFEEAYEWENMTWVFYPYFWGRKSQWVDRASYGDTDPDFADFIRAGAARVTLPVRPGFETSIEHFMLTGEIWEGADPPALTDPDYVSIAEEQRRRSGSARLPTPVGDPWTVKVPTSLVKLRTDSRLPSWVKDPTTGEYRSTDEA